MGTQRVLQIGRFPKWAAWRARLWTVYMTTSGSPKLYMPASATQSSDQINALKSALHVRDTRAVYVDSDRSDDNNVISLIRPAVAV